MRHTLLLAVLVLASTAAAQTAPDVMGCPSRLWTGRGGHIGLSRFMPMGGLRIRAETGRGGALVGTVVSSTDAIGDWAASAERAVRLEREPCPGR